MKLNKFLQMHNDVLEIARITGKEVVVVLWQSRRVSPKQWSGNYSVTVAFRNSGATIMPGKKVFTGRTKNDLFENIRFSVDEWIGDWNIKDPMLSYFCVRSIPVTYSGVRSTSVRRFLEANRDLWSLAKMV